ncbi:DUF2141 domain-containing protein [Aurantiacibacter sp. MUD11]|uniref:DUF2141 domain-containing protein n=1 Tax=Aurantiacibacter sp. MUD11 TaxID=3003265 RepID=UPI0022AA9FBC|nr:DUF2141 domain-containing protein [Aurantiacibacter sp. MUD11]WAT17103.1 DUF2141 domain-containing protein [Aurantiacibacter sp. MUD11]
MTQRLFRIFATALLAVGLAVPAGAQYRNEMRHSIAPCQGSGPAVWIQVTNISNSEGMLRIQLYPGTRADWLERGRWLNRIEVPAREGTMQICMPAPAPGDYAIAIRHDRNGNGRTDITSDGGGMSNNPSINIFNLGKPGVDKTRFTLGREVLPMRIRMRYL